MKKTIKILILGLLIGDIIGSIIFHGEDIRINFWYTTITTIINFSLLYKIDTFKGLFINNRQINK